MGPTVGARPVLPLLVVDGYNVLFADDGYRDLANESVGEGAVALAGDDPFDRAREALVADVAAFAGHDYEAVIVFDGARNVSPERPALTKAGVRLIFSKRGQSGDEAIEELVAEARQVGRPVALVTSDATVRAVAGEEVTRLSSRLFIGEARSLASERRQIQAEHSHGRGWALSDRLDPATRARLDALVGRRRER